MTVREIASFVGGDIVGDGEIEISRVAKIQEAGAGDITFLANPKYAKYVESTHASALLISKGAEVPARKSPLTLIAVPDAYRAFLRVLELFHPSVHSVAEGIHATAVVPKTAVLGKRIAIGPHVVVGENCKCGDGVVVYPGTVLHDGVELGDDTVLYSNVTIREGCKIGSRVIVHSGAVIGSDGFGFAPRADGSYEKIPQRGIVVVEDDVEIGANTTIDRATIGETRIKRGVKLDNLVMIAHNVELGDNTAVAAQSGISGSTKLGKQCVLAGQVGIIGHLDIPDRTTFLARSGVGKVSEEPGKTYFGAPAKEAHKAARIEAAIRQLPELLREVEDLRRRLDELEAKQKSPLSKS
jgi:UDP-3-O-[3-hydroxymyristoyl] glucosamine N-acyltransferase